MSDAADDAREQEENFDLLRALHGAGRCEPDCPFCDSDFEPIFTFQQGLAGGVLTSDQLCGK